MTRRRNLSLCRTGRKDCDFYLTLYTGLSLDEHIERDSEVSITEPFDQGCLFWISSCGKIRLSAIGKAYHFDIARANRMVNY